MSSKPRRARFREMRGGPLTGTQRRAMVVLVVAAVLALDQATKAWALATLQDRVIHIVPTVQFRLAYNSGFSFGMGAEYGPIVAVVVVVIAFLVGRAAVRERRLVRSMLLAAILGGALGNIVDRVLRAEAGPLSGSVVDFIAVTWYAVFNVADMFVVCGAVLLALAELRGAWSGETQSEPTPSGL